MLTSPGEGNMLDKVNLGSLGSFAGRLSIGSGGQVLLRQLQTMATSEWAFEKLLAELPDLSDEMGLYEGATHEDSIKAYNRFRRSMITTRLDPQANILTLRCSANTRGLSHACVRALGTAIVSKVNEIRRDLSKKRGKYLAEQSEWIKQQLVAAEDSLIVLLENNRLGSEVPRIQQQIENARRRVDLWSNALQAMSAEQISMEARAALDIPDVYPPFSASRFEQRSGFSVLSILMLSSMAGIAVFLFLGFLATTRR